jgi:hypothetical protein
MDAMELLLRAHEHVFTLRPLFEKGAAERMHIRNLDAIMIVISFMNNVRDCRRFSSAASLIIHILRALKQRRQRRPRPQPSGAELQRQGIP